MWEVPKIVVPPKSSILIGFSIINHPFWGTPIFGNTHVSSLDLFKGSGQMMIPQNCVFPFCLSTFGIQSSG